MLYSPFVERALRFAAEKHASQFRKETKIPYLTHLASVALILTRAGFDDEEILAAALLHDAIEDAAVTAETIATMFSPRVAELVVAASEVKLDAKGDKLPWEVRKNEHLARLRSASAAAGAIVLADKLHNLGTMLDDLEVDPGVWCRFNADASAQVWYYTAVLEAVGDDSSLERLRAEYRTLLDRLTAAVPKADS